MSILSVLENVSQPVPLSDQLIRFFGHDNPMSLLEFAMCLDSHSAKVSPDVVELDDQLQTLFNTDHPRISMDLYNKYVFASMPLMLINTIDYYLIVNNNRYLWEDLQIDRKMFGIVVGPSCKFKNLPGDIIETIRTYLFNGTLPFDNPYYLDVYESLDGHDANAVKFWKRI